MIEQVRRRMMMGGSVKPYDAEVEYLENNPELYQCINTGVYVVGDNNRLEIEFDYLLNTNNKTICGSQGVINNGVDNIRPVFAVHGQKIFVYGGIGEEINRASDDYFYPGHHYNLIFSANNNIVNGTINNNSISYPAATFYGENLTHPLALFGIYRTILQQFTNTRIYRFAFRNNYYNIDMIPVRIGNIGYMYDKVSKRLFGNQGKGQFIIGPDKTT